MKTGNILVSKWGYDQTNVDFYKVVKHTKTTVSIVQIKSDEIHTKDFTFTALPLDIPKNDKIITKKIRIHDGKEYIRLEDYSRAPIAKLWDETVIQGTTYA